MNFDDIEVGDNSAVLEERRYAALEAAVLSLTQAISDISPSSSYRDPAAAVTRSVSLSEEQLDTRRRNILHLTYFIINAVTRKRVFYESPEANPSREVLNMSYNRHAMLPLTESTLFEVVSHCLKHFSQVLDITMSFSLANDITKFMGFNLVCEECGKQFNSTRDLHSHDAFGHQRPSCFRKCSFYKCCKVFESFPILMYHHNEDHGFIGNWQQNTILFKVLENQAKLIEYINEINPIPPPMTTSTLNPNISTPHTPARQSGSRSVQGNQGGPAPEHRMPSSGASCSGSNSFRTQISTQNPHDPRSEVLSAMLNPPPRNQPVDGSNSVHGSDSNSSGEIPTFPSAMDNLFQEYSSSHFFGSGEH